MTRGGFAAGSPWWSASELPDIPTPELERELGVRIRDHGDADAWRELVVRNLRLVIHLAGRKRHPAGIDADDLISAGIEGLMRAASKFDPDRARFTTYASWWVHQAMGRVCGTAIYVPHDVNQELARMLRAGVDPEVDELADRFRAAWEANRPLRLDAPVAGAEGDDVVLHGVVADRGAVDAEEAAVVAVRAVAVRRAVARLPERQRSAVVLRYGLEGGGPMSLAAVARELGVSPQGAAQLVRRAEAALAVALEEEGVVDATEEA